jgi:hypothetical protein
MRVAKHTEQVGHSTYVPHYACENRICKMKLLSIVTSGLIALVVSACSSEAQSPATDESPVPESALAAIAADPSVVEEVHAHGFAKRFVPVSEENHVAVGSASNPIAPDLRPEVICNMVGDAIVCVVIPKG